MISSPLRLFDCDVPCDGATAVIVSRRRASRGSAPSQPIYVEAMGAAMHDRPELGPATRT